MARIIQTFLRAEREQAKANATNSMSYDYIDALEEIAKAAHAVWTYSGTDASKRDTLHNNLYDALAAVNFMDETL